MEKQNILPVNHMCKISAMEGIKKHFPIKKPYKDEVVAGSSRPESTMGRNIKAGSWSGEGRLSRGEQIFSLNVGKGRTSYPQLNFENEFFGETRASKEKEGERNAIGTRENWFFQFKRTGAGFELRQSTEPAEWGKKKKKKKKST